MICAMCYTANYFDAKHDVDTAVRIHRTCTGGGCTCQHQVVGHANSVESSKES